MTTTPETWTRYPRSTDPAKDVAALSARLISVKVWLKMLAGEIKHEWRDAADLTDALADKVLDLCAILDREHDDWIAQRGVWIAQRGVEAVRKAVMPEGEWE